MLHLPIDKKTFHASFLDGRGRLDLLTDQDAWKELWKTGGAFTPKADRIADLTLGAGSPALLLGHPNGQQLSVAASARASGRIELIWPDQASDNPLVQEYDLAAYLGKLPLCAALVLGGSARVAANANAPTGPLSARFAAGAGGRAELLHLKPYDPRQPARDIVHDLLATTRLPRSVDTINDIPVPGEVLAITYDGYLHLGATLTWGYQVNGVRSYKPGDLDLAFSYLVKLAASLSVACRVAGAHTIQARHGHADGWVRFVVKKSHSSESSFAADLGLDASVELKGLPKTPDEFLAALLGADVGAALGVLRQAGEYDSIDEIRAQLDALAFGFLENLAQPWIGRALDNNTVQELLRVAHEVVTAYETLDQRLVDLYQRNLDALAALTSRIDDLAKLTSRERLLDWVEGMAPNGVVDNQAWHLVRDEWGDEFFDLLLDNDAFAAFHDFVLQAQTFLTGGAQERIRQFVSAAKEQLNLSSFIKDLAQYDTAKKLQDAADARLHAFVDRVLGIGFRKLKGKELEAAFEKIQAFLKEVEGFKIKWYEKLKGAAQQSISMQVAYNYARTARGESLVDVEVNLNDERGASLAQRAAVGDFAGVLTAYDPALVRVNRGTRMTRHLQASSTLLVNVVGLNYSRAVDIVQDLDHYTETDPGGLVHVYAVDTKVDVTQRSFRETQHSSLLLQFVGSSLQRVGTSAPVDARGRFLADTIRKMAVTYDMTQTDRRTTFREMRGYLDLARELGLVRDVDQVLERLLDEFPQHPEALGEVEVSYAVRYEPEGVMSVFIADNLTQLALARSVARQVVGRSFLAGGPGHPLYSVGIGYLSGNRDAFLGDASITVQVTPDLRKPGLAAVVVRKDQKLLVRTLFAIEETFVSRLEAFDALVDQMRKHAEPVPVEAIQRAALSWAKMNAKLERFSHGGQSINAFFVVFDRLVRAATVGRARRKSALIVSILPPGGTSKVTKYFVDDGAPEGA